MKYYVLYEYDVVEDNIVDNFGFRWSTKWVMFNTKEAALSWIAYVRVYRRFKVIAGPLEDHQQVESNTLTEGRKIQL